MKFKFRAEREDVTIFVIFAIFLLYIVAIGVLNLHSFAVEGRLYGLNPIPAFFPQYIAATLMLYIFALIGVFASVGSYFFDMEEGFGFVSGKKDKGYSRWAKEREIQQEEKVEVVDMKNPREKYAGVPLLYKGNNIWVDNGENHTLVIGATGSGKTQCIVLPTVKILSKKRESMIITDPKGEIYEKTSNMLRAKGYQILLLNFRDPQNGNAWNPMALPYKMYKQGNQDKAIELLDDLALNILYDDSNKNADPFWEKTSADYFSGVALGLFEDAKEEEININSVSLATTIGEEKFGGSTYIKEYFAEKDPTSAAAIDAQSTIMAPTETKGGILAVFKQKVKLFASRANLSEMLSHSDISLESIGEKPTAVYIVIQDEKKTYHSLVTILLKQIYETLIGVAQKHGGKLPVRTNFLLDEFANMPPLKDVTTMITAARSRQIRFTMIIQNFAQLDAVYGKEDAETLRGNCGNIIYLVTTELKALEEISKMCGEVKSKKDDKTASTPLVTVSDLQRMKENDVILMRLRMHPFKTHFTPDWKCDWGKKYSEAKYPTRKKREVHTFDIKEFVKERKKKKLLDMMNANSSMETPNNRGLNEPHQGMMPSSNPFAQGIESRKPNIPVNNPFESIPKRPAARPPMDKDEEDDESGGFDVDELVRKIDAKIAELEEEEKKEQQNNKEIRKEPEKKEPEIKEEVNEEPKLVETKPEIKPKTPTINLDLEDEEDDEFFDDFFDN